MRWRPSERFPSFLRWLTRFAKYLGIERKCVCLPMAYHYYRKGLDPFETFKAWAR